MVFPVSTIALMKHLVFGAKKDFNILGFDHCGDQLDSGS